MCTMKIESGLGYKSSQVRVISPAVSIKSNSKSKSPLILFKSESKSRKNGLKSGLESKSGLQ